MEIAFKLWFWVKLSVFVCLFIDAFDTFKKSLLLLSIICFTIWFAGVAEVICDSGFGVELVKCSGLPLSERSAEFRSKECFSNYWPVASVLASKWMAEVLLPCFGCLLVCLGAFTPDDELSMLVFISRAAPGPFNGVRDGWSILNSIRSLRKISLDAYLTILTISSPFTDSLFVSWVICLPRFWSRFYKS